MQQSNVNLPSSPSSGGAFDLVRTVIDGGYCIGCGACAALPGSPFKIELSKFGLLQARLSADPGELSDGVGQVCPFSDSAVDENQIATERFSAACQKDDRIGFYCGNYAGYVKEGAFRTSGSSGGFGTWLQAELMKEGMVQGVIHVRSRTPDDTDPRLFEYSMVTDRAEVQGGSKSRYYPIEMSEMLKEVRFREKEFALVGLPCFIKAVQLLRRIDPELKRRIPICIGLVCGHLKSTRFAENFAWQMGVSPKELSGFDFRKKLPNAPASSYAVEATGGSGQQKFHKTAKSRELFGADWGLDFFKYNACDYCDDVLAETADVTVGDAWLPKYVSDSGGTNILVVRNPQIKGLLEAANKEGRIVLDLISPDDIAQSQDAGLRHRRQGLAYRLFLADRRGRWRPKKRIPARSDHLGFLGKRKFRNRMKLCKLSHEIFQEALEFDDPAHFQNKMLPIVGRYYRSLNPQWYRLLRTFMGVVRFPLRWLRGGGR